MSYLEVFRVLTAVGVDVSKFFGGGAGAGVLIIATMIKFYFYF